MCENGLTAAVVGESLLLLPRNSEVTELARNNDVTEPKRRDEVREEDSVVRSRDAVDREYEFERSRDAADVGRRRDSEFSQSSVGKSRSCDGIETRLSSFHHRAETSPRPHEAKDSLSPDGTRTGKTDSSNWDEIETSAQPRQSFRAVNSKTSSFQKSRYSSSSLSLEEEVASTSQHLPPALGSLLSLEPDQSHAAQVRPLFMEQCACSIKRSVFLSCAEEYG